MDNKNRVTIMLSIKNNIDYAREWMMQMALFNPTKMKLRHYKKNKFVSYKEKVFVEEISKEIDETNYSFMLEDDINVIDAFMNCNSTEVAILSAMLDYDIFIRNEEKIYTFINDIMTQTGIVGRIASLEDHVLQNNIDVEEYKRRKKSLFGVPLKPHPIFKGQKAIAVEKLPGYEELIGNITFGADWKMWFHDSYYQYVSEDAIVKFQDCYSNEKISDTCRCITLYENLLDYDKYKHRRRQWKFKKATKFKETVKELKEKGTLANNDPHIEISNGDFEHGGVKMFRVYFDEKGNTVRKSKATKVKIAEYNQAGKIVWETEEDSF